MLMEVGRYVADAKLRAGAQFPSDWRCCCFKPGTPQLGATPLHGARRRVAQQTKRRQMRLSGGYAHRKSCAQISKVVPIGLPFTQEQQLRQRGTVPRLEPKCLFARARCGNEI